MPPDPTALDAADPLASFRDRFAVEDPDVVYLDGNSLGRAPTRTLERLARVARREWAGELVGGWDRWVDLPTRIGDAVAAGILGAEPGTVAVTDSTTVNLYRVAAAALDDLPDRPLIVAGRDDFPTDRYVLEGLARERGRTIRWLDADPAEGIATADITAAIDDAVALVVLSLVNYRTGAIVDADAVEQAARATGAHVLWDLSHAAGVVPVDLAARGIGLAVGCTYKYLHGGPGAPAFLFVAPPLQARLRPPVQGWFAQGDQFAMGPAFDRAPGIAGWLVGTPPVLSLVGVEEGVALVAEAGVAAIRSEVDGPHGLRGRAGRRGARAARLHARQPARSGPSRRARRGPPPRGAGIAAGLVARGVVVDFREPDVVRLGLAPLTTSFADVRRGIDALRDLAAAMAGGPAPG